MSALSEPQTSPLYTPRAKNVALLLLATTQFVIVIDASIVNVALPSIGRALNVSRTDLSWVVNAYALTFGGFLLLGGRMVPVAARRLRQGPGQRRTQTPAAGTPPDRGGQGEAGRGL